MRNHETKVFSVPIEKYLKEVRSRHSIEPEFASMFRESGKLLTTVTVAKYRGSFKQEAEALAKGKEPFEVLRSFKNVFLNEGINNLWTLVCSATGTKWDSGNARCGVGNSNAAENATQVALQGASKDWHAMDATYPTYGTSQYATWKSTFDTGHAEWAWEEYTVVNSADDSGANLNRKISSKGTKGSGETWVLTIQCTIT